VTQMKIFVLLKAVERYSYR